jgi:hypothetical protein
MSKIKAFVSESIEMPRGVWYAACILAGGGITVWFDIIRNLL